MSSPTTVRSAGRGQTQRAVIGGVIARVLWTAGATPENRRLLTSAINTQLGGRPAVMSPEALPNARWGIKNVIKRVLWTSRARAENIDLLTDAIYQALLAMPPMPNKLTTAQRRILENLGAGKPWNNHLRGRSAYGGASGTIVSLNKLGLIFNMEITDAGRALLALGEVA